MKLQPIETAPKDGTFFVGYKPLVGKMLGARHDFFTVRWVAENGGYWWSPSNTKPEATHWMPLPNSLKDIDDGTT
jgi:hypothetical protein